MASTKRSYTGDKGIDLTMNLFGLPYQFPHQVDPRIADLNPNIGKKYAENILLEGPVMTLIPGSPKYMKGTSSETRRTASNLLLDAADGSMDPLKGITPDGDDQTLMEKIRIYDFESDYTSYMRYVNAMCRAGAGFLGLDQSLTVGSDAVPLTRFDWSKYKWNRKWGSGLITRFIKSKTSDVSIGSGTSADDDLSDLLTSGNFVQFYVDAESTDSGDAMDNTSSESQLKSVFDSGSALAREFKFYAGSDSGLSEFTDASASALSEMVEGIVGSSGGTSGVGNALSRIINIGSNVLKGENIIIPNIYQSSSHPRQYDAVIKLRTPYGGKLSYFLDIFVPMMHLVGFAIPKQSTANTYSSPFIVKGFIEGTWSCNMGLVTSIQIQKSQESRSVDGLPTEVDVRISIEDLYSDLTMSSASDPVLFAGNTSLVEFLATNCGMSLSKPNYKARYENLIRSVENAFIDIPSTVAGSVNESVYRFINQFTSLV